MRPKVVITVLALEKAFHILHNTNINSTDSKCDANNSQIYPKYFLVLDTSFS